MRGDYDAAHVSRLVRQTVRAVTRAALWTRARTEADCWPHDCVQHVVRLNDSGARGGKVLLVLYELERAFLYFPERTVVASPAYLGLVAEEVTIQAAERMMLTGYWLAGRGERVLVWYYGNAGNLSYRLPLARVLLDCFGLDILLVDYRGYGRSQGQPTEDGLYADGLAMYAYAVQGL